MRKLKFVILAVVLIIPSKPVFSGEDTGHLTVLMYHRFDAGGAISTPMKDFKRQVNYLENNNFNFLTLDEVREHLQKREVFPKKSVLITIDDGYKSTYTHAYPFLKKKEIPWVLYVYTEAIENKYSSTLSWDQIQTMVDNGVEVENHTFSHGHPTLEEFREGDWVQRELREPHKLIERKVDQSIESFAIPYGEYDDQLIDLLKNKMDYPVVWGIDPGVVDPRDPAEVLPRFGINGSTSWEDFKKKLNRLPLKAEKISPEPGSQIERGSTINIKLSNPEDFNKGLINMFLSEKGALEWEWSENETSITYTVKKSFEEPWNRIILTAYDSEAGQYRYLSRGYVTK